MFDQNNVNLAPGAIGTQPRSSTTIPIAPLLAKSLASTGDARAQIILRSMITGYRARSGHWQPQPKQPSAPVICRFIPELRGRTLSGERPAMDFPSPPLSCVLDWALGPLQFRKPILGNFNLFKTILAFLTPSPLHIFMPGYLILISESFCH